MSLFQTPDRLRHLTQRVGSVDYRDYPLWVLCALRVSVVVLIEEKLTTEASRTQRWHGEIQIETTHLFMNLS